ncbi:hypothetical protein Cgig2_003824 [Carnegiea gigantea]|uniref:Uncharacterized protein n=1 Tax=Carnegiea gigantea TaxID=171969 RepID=A0A9Q1QKE6_9CARY|nr:hypothetical protein Cgig2_003824 [Carnegiea gigantea]
MSIGTLICINVVIVNRGKHGQVFMMDLRSGRKRGRSPTVEATDIGESNSYSETEESDSSYKNEECDSGTSSLLVSLGEEASTSSSGKLGGREMPSKNRHDRGHGEVKLHKHVDTKSFKLRQREVPLSVYDVALITRLPVCGKSAAFQRIEVASEVEVLLKGAMEDHVPHERGRIARGVAWDLISIVEDVRVIGDESLAEPGEGSTLVHHGGEDAVECRLSPPVHSTKVRHAHGPLEAMHASLEDTNVQFSVVDNKVDVGYTIEKGNESAQQVLMLALPAVHMKAVDDLREGLGFPRQRNPSALQSSFYLNLKRAVKKGKSKCTKNDAADVALSLADEEGSTLRPTTAYTALEPTNMHQGRDDCRICLPEVVNKGCAASMGHHPLGPLPLDEHVTKVETNPEKGMERDENPTPIVVVVGTKERHSEVTPSTAVVVGASPPYTTFQKEGIEKDENPTPITAVVGTEEGHSEVTPSTAVVVGASRLYTTFQKEDSGNVATSDPNVGSVSTPRTHTQLIPLRAPAVHAFPMKSRLDEKDLTKEAYNTLPLLTSGGSSTLSPRDKKVATSLAVMRTDLYTDVLTWEVTGADCPQQNK